MDMSDKRVLALQKSKLQLSNVLKTLSLEDDEVLNVYLVGSRLWGVFSHHSDWDFIIIHAAWKSKPLDQHTHNYDAHILSRKDFMEAIGKHSMQMLVCLWLPKQFVLRETFDPRLNFKLDKSALAHVMQQQKTRDIRMAEKYCLKSEVQRCKKTLIHLFRLLLLAKQIAEKGFIGDYTCANEMAIEMQTSVHDTVFVNIMDMFSSHLNRAENEFLVSVSS